jgi:hypothetical protein
MDPEEWAHGMDVAHDSVLRVDMADSSCDVFDLYPEECEHLNGAENVSMIYYQSKSVFIGDEVGRQIFR